MNIKKHTKHILRSIQKAFDISDSRKEYEEICKSIYFSECKLPYETFEKLKKLIC